MSAAIINPDPENVALFDMDGTLCDYDLSLEEQLRLLAGPGEAPVPFNMDRDHLPPHINNRINLVTKSSDWWANLPRHKLGFDVLEVAQKLGFRVMILTQAPKRNAAAWLGKKVWLDRELGQNTDVTMTRDKGLVYGKILVDDFPEYIKRWLEWRKRGLVIMPANKRNADFTHPQVIRYDGKNLGQVRSAMKAALLRKNLEPLVVGKKAITDIR